MRRRILIAAVIVVPLVIAAALVVLVLRQRAQEARTAELLAQWQAAGGALTLAELKPEPIPDEQNAAVLYEPAWVELDQLSDAERVLLRDAELTAQSRAVLGKLDEAIGLAVRAGNRRECVWMQQYWSVAGLVASASRGQVPDILSLVDDMRTLADAVCLAGLDAAAQGDAVRAVELFTASRKLGVNTMKRGTGIAFFAGSAIDAKALDSFERAFRDRPLPDNLPPELFLLPDFDELQRRTLIVEGTQAIEGIAYEYEDGLSEAEYDERLQFVLTAMCHALNELDKPLEDRSNLFPKASEFPPSIRSVPGMTGTVANSMLDVLIAELAVELRRHRDAHGEYPASWDELARPVLRQQLNYVRTGPGFEIRQAIHHPASPPLWQWQ